MREMSAKDDLLVGFELHAEDNIRAALSAGVDVHRPIDGKLPIEILIEMYTRSPRFAGCLRVLLDAGASLNDPALEAVLLDDAAQLRAALDGDSEGLHRRRSVRSAYTSLEDASLLHVAAEYNSLDCARFLLASGVDADVRAGTDDEGLGGQTPLFHTVNSNQNLSRPAMELLVEYGANLEIRLKGLVWGGGFEWETVVYDVSPISYAQCGLYFQFHRPEAQVYSNLRYLMEKRHGGVPKTRNVPNKYLRDDRVFPPRT